MPLIDLNQRSLTDALEADGVVALALDSALAAPLTALPAGIRSKLILVAPLGIDPHLLELARHEAVGAVILATSPPGEDELADAVSRLRTPEMGPVTGRLAVGAPVASLELNESARRGEVLDAIERFFKPQGFDVRLLNHLLSSADELLTNALYHAPLDGMGSRVFAHRSKIDPVTMPVGHPVTISWGYDGRRALVAVRDSYGSLDRATLLGALPSLTQAGMLASSGGLGLRSALRGASMLAIHVVPGSHSDCVAVVDVEGGYRQFAQRGKTLEIFYAAA